MRATCPSCDAVYEIPDRLIGAGRRLRCANCGHEWTLLPAAAEPPPPAPEPPAAPPPKPAPASAPRVETPAWPPAGPAGAPPAYPMLRRPPQVIDPPLPAVDDNTGRRRGQTALRAAWIGSVLLVALAIAALWAFRYEIATAWPPAARLVGSPVGGG
jgi:predicted Zn finger-like uncharacterized protein